MFDMQEDDDLVYDAEFIKQEFNQQISEWRENYEQSSDYCEGFGSY